MSLNLNLNTIHKPTTLDEAITHLRQPGTYPLYGGVALQRGPNPAVTAAVDLNQLGLDYVRDTERSLRLGSMLTLEQMRQACAQRAEDHPHLGGLAEIIAAEMPEPLRHTMTLGDLLVERNPQSLILTAFLALDGIVKRIDLEMRLTMAAWLLLKQDVARYLTAQIRIMRGSKRCVMVYEKVARTPADAPIVGAVACLNRNADDSPSRSTLALCGVAPTPLPQPNVLRAWEQTGDIETALDQLTLDPPDDHWGSREYRTEMARVISRRVLLRAVEEAR